MTLRSASAFLLCVLATSTFAADKDVEALLAKMRTAYKSAKSVTMTTLTLVPGPFGDAEIETVVSYSSPNKIHAVVKGIPEAGGSDMTVRSDGKNMVVEGLPNGKIKRPYDEQLFVQALTANLETLCFWDWKRQLSTAKGDNMEKSTFKLIAKEMWKDKPYIVLEETAAGQNVFVRYFIDGKSSLIMRTVVTAIDDKETIQMDARISKMDLKAKLSPALFKID